MIEIAKIGRIATHAPEAEALPTQQRQIAARKAWRSSDQPDWLTAEFYANQIQPRLFSLSSMRAVGIEQAWQKVFPFLSTVPHPLQSLFSCGVGSGDGRGVLPLAALQHRKRFFIVSKD